MGEVFQTCATAMFTHNAKWTTNPLFQEVPRHAFTMRQSWSALPWVLLLLLTTASPMVMSSTARSVHSTSDIDLFPQGGLYDPGEWSVGTETSFTQEEATYTESMVADQRLSMVHQRPVNLDTMTVWASSSPTNSNYSIGAPDGAATWSTGPEIELTGFDVSGLSTYELHEVHMKGVFQIPDALSEDTVRISVQHTDGFDLLKTFAHTQGNVDYINNSAFSLNLTGLMNWTWDDVSTMIFTLDYVSAGGVDDSRLVVDALGLAITVQTPWYGGEVGYGKSTFTGHEMPVLGLNLSSGSGTNMALDNCGLKPSIEGTTGEWESDLFTHPPEQTLGRVHASVSEGGLSNITVEVALSQDGVSVGPYASIDQNTLLPQALAYQLRITAIDACVDHVWIDVNDPSLSLSGRVFGTNDGIDSNYSRWLVFVNDEVVSNEALSLGSFSHEWPIGAYMRPGTTSLTVEVKAWFTWDSDGSASTTALEFNSFLVTGGYDVEWDEDPMCETLGDQYLTEDNGGIILPFMRRCTDDRTANENLVVQFTNSDTDLVAVDLTEGDIRLRLLPEASGQAVIGVTVLDTSGNAWTDSFTLIVDSVDDPPVIEEFQSLIPVERDVSQTINMSWFDVDSTGLTASTNRSWATVDLPTSTLTVMPPNAGYHTVLVSLCDQTTCSEREVDLEVMALADLVVESIDFGSESLTQGDVVAMRVLVRNEGYASASMVSVRCETDDQLMALTTIAVIEPGELRAVTCDWQVPDDARVLRFSAVVDRGLEIPEGNEDNNRMELLMAIDENPATDTSSDTDSFASSVLRIGFIVICVGLLGLLAFMMPDKVKKIE